ncbi:MAG TPA: hypothetical protein VFP05_13775 [Thermomicrobiales bacterium]|nr:hypothetical protein [Thermomicrobiales bacterium]
MPRPTKRSRLLAVAAVLLMIATVAGSLALFGPVRAQDDSPVGQWSVAITRTDVPVDIASSFSYVGRWRLGIETDGTYDAERLDVGATVVSGTWTVDGDQITFTDDDGLLSCSNAAAAPIIDDDIATGAYTWTRSGKTLTLTRVDDACPGRVILLTTFSFSTFVPCSTAPLSMAELLGSPVASPIAEAPDVTASPESITSVLTPDASPAAIGSAEAAPELASTASPAPVRLDFATEVDDLLAQLTACWASREPERWLPLLSDEFRDSLIQSDPNFLETLTISMTSPIVWERSGDITIEAPNQISCIVKSTVGTEEDYQKFVFVFEDGQWKWNG